MLEVSADRCCLAADLVHLLADIPPRVPAYTVWTGIGAVGAFVVGVVMLGEPLTIERVVRLR